MYVVYSTGSCPYCDRAKVLLEQKEVDFRVVDVGEDVDAQKMFREKALRSVPQIFDEKQAHIGGYTDLVDHFNRTLVA